jgi:hypothetical protein
MSKQEGLTEYWRLVVIIAATGWMMASCGAYDISDFSPAIGKGQGPVLGDNGPWARRLRIATSNNGLNWKRIGTTITDQGDVPHAIIKDGALWVIYVMWSDLDNSPELKNRTVAAYSKDLKNWTYKKLTISRLPEGYSKHNPVDPSVVELADGRYRIYFTLGNSEGGHAATFSAISNNLLNWQVEEGIRFGSSNSDVLDPNLLDVGDHYEFFAGGVQGTNYHATSTDGLNFIRLPDMSSSPFIVMANGLKVGEQFKYYGFTQTVGNPEKKIRSFTYNNSAEWILDEGDRLSIDESDGEERDLVTDPAVISHPSGAGHGYVMIYVTQIP